MFFGRDLVVEIVLQDSFRGTLIGFDLLHQGGEVREGLL
jgi:hypothetical protein